MKTILSTALLLSLVAAIFIPSVSFGIDASTVAGGLSKPTGYSGKVTLPLPCTDSGYTKWVFLLIGGYTGFYMVDLTKMALKPYKNRMWIIPLATHLGMRKAKQDSCEVCIGNYCYEQPWQYEIEFAGTAI